MSTNTHDMPSSTPALIRKDGKLVLTYDKMQLSCDFNHMRHRFNASALQGELIVKAARLKHDKHPVIVDATAGLGEDAALLAAAGYQLILIEKNPIIAALVQDGLRRAADDQQLKPIRDKMELIEGDSIQLLSQIKKPIDIVFLDPMFPQREKSAAVKKKLQLLQLIEEPCSNEEELLRQALHTALKKVIVKRPVKGPYLAGKKPHHSLAGKAIRFDCYMPTL